MKLSKYTIFYDNHPKEGESLALNTRTQSVVLLDRELKSVLEGLPRTDNLSPEASAMLKQLVDRGFIVGDDVDEHRLLKDWFDRIKYQTRTMTVMILTTYQCNFACEYCFEEAVKCNASMDDATTVAVREWLKKEAAQHRPDTLRLIFYGGEPFLNPAPMLEIGTELQEWCRGQGIKFNFGAITNGSLLNVALIEQLKAVGLTNLRVTLDGPPEVHDAHRPFRSGHGTFKNILSNIHAVADKVRIDIGGNFDRNTLPHIPKLLDILEAEGLKPKLGPVLFAPVMARLGTESATVELTGCKSLSGELMRETVALRAEVIRRGFRVDRGVAITTCPMTRDGAMFVIDPSGEIYKCAAFVGRPEFSVGTVREPNLNYRHVEFMTMRSPLDEAKCRECVYLPMCGGGCCFSAQLQHGNCAQVSCEKDYYDQVFPEILKMDYARGVLVG